MVVRGELVEQKGETLSLTGTVRYGTVLYCLPYCTVPYSLTGTVFSIRHNGLWLAVEKMKWKRNKNASDLPSGSVILGGQWEGL